MRAFIAISLPKDIRDSLAALKDKLNDCKAKIKWVTPANIHLTLKFLGDIDEGNLRKVMEIIENIAKITPPFQISISALGAFPSINDPRVIWAGIHNGNKESQKISMELEKEIAKIGIPEEERAFSPHITLGRIKSKEGERDLAKELRKQMEKFGKETLEFKAQNISLYKSTLTPKGPIYEIVKEAALATN